MSVPCLFYPLRGPCSPMSGRQRSRCYRCSVVSAVLVLPSPRAAYSVHCSYSCSLMSGRQLFCCCQCRACSTLSGGLAFPCPGGSDPVVIGVALSVPCLFYPLRGQLIQFIAAIPALPCPGGSYSVVVSAVLALPSPGALLSHVREAAISLLSV